MTGDPTPDRRKGYHEVDIGGALIKAVINHCAMKGPIALPCGMYRSAGVSRPAPPIGILMEREPVENVAGSGWQFRHRQIADSAAKASASSAPLIAQAATRPAKLVHQARRIASKDHAAPPVQTVAEKPTESVSNIAGQEFPLNSSRFGVRTHNQSMTAAVKTQADPKALAPGR